MKNNNSIVTELLVITTIIFLILFLPTSNFAQDTKIKTQILTTQKTLITPTNNVNDVIQIGGSKFVTNNEGKCIVKIPEEYLKKIKASPNKYKISLRIVNIPADYYRTKLKNVKPNVETKFNFLLKANYGNKLQELGKFTNNIKDVNKLNEVSLSKSDVYLIRLSDPNSSNVTFTVTCAGEPVPGAEVYVEEEGNNEP